MVSTGPLFIALHDKPLWDARDIRHREDCVMSCGPSVGHHRDFQIVVWLDGSTAGVLTKSRCNFNSTRMGGGTPGWSRSLKRHT